MMLIDPGSPNPPESLSVVWLGNSLAQANDRVLVILAMQLTCQMDRDPASGAYAILSDPAQEGAIREEIAAYEKEQAEHIEYEPIHLPTFSSGAWITFLWVLALLGMFHFQGELPTLTDDTASSNVALLEQGEWWRPFTALFLHADLGHLFGNILFGVLFCTLVCRSLGAVIGWLLILGAGVLGNTLTALIYYPSPFSSLGASTAVFGAVGVLTGYGFCVAFRSPANAPWTSIVLPIGGGLALLAWFGAGGTDTDLLGHLSGFAVGLPLGFAATWWRLRSVFADRRHVTASASA